MRKTFKMEVDCANCAAKVEHAIAQIDGVNACTVNFMTQKLVLDCDESRLEEILAAAKKAAKKVDSDTVIYS
jgi:cation transport ATPase